VDVAFASALRALLLLLLLLLLRCCDAAML